MFSYCGNNPVSRADDGGTLFYDVLDIYFAADSIVTVLYDPTAENIFWAFLDVVALLPGIPSSGYLRKASKLINVSSDIGKAASEYNALKYAETYGIKAYNELRKLTKGSGLEAHHIIEGRFANRLGLSKNNMLCVALTKEEHKAFTNEWRKQIPYGTNYNDLSLSRIWDAAKTVYKDYPELLEIAKRTIYPKGAR